VRARQGDLGVFSTFRPPNLFDADRLDQGQWAARPSTQTGARSVIEVITNRTPNQGD
jgi:hypothetical protein